MFNFLSTRNEIEHSSTNMASDHLVVFFTSYILGRLVLSDSVFAALPVAAAALCIFERGCSMRKKNQNVFTQYITRECNEYNFCETVDNDNRDNLLPTTTTQLPHAGYKVVDVSCWSDSVTEEDVRRFVPLQKNEDYLRHIDLSPGNIEFSPHGFSTDYCMDIDSCELSLLKQAHLITSRSTTMFSWSDLGVCLLPGGYALVTIICRNGATEERIHSRLNRVVKASKLPLLPILGKLSTVIDSVEQQPNLELAGVFNLNDRFKLHNNAVMEKTRDSMGYAFRMLFGLCYIYNYLIDTNSARVLLVAVRKRETPMAESEDRRCADDGEQSEQEPSGGEEEQSDVEEPSDAEEEPSDAEEEPGNAEEEPGNAEEEPGGAEEDQSDEEETKNPNTDNSKKNYENNQTEPTSEEDVQEGGLNFDWVIGQVR